MKKTKNLIFDLGGVLLNLDMLRTEQAFFELGITKFPDLFAILHDYEIFLKLETGHIEPGVFVETLRQQAHPGVQPQQVIDAWNALLMDFREGSLDFLEKASAKYKVFLLSNTNAIHEDFFKQQYTITRSGKQMDDLFTKAYYSHKMGLRKPEKEIFDFVLNDSKLLPEETIFIDDNLSNVTTAKSMGIDIVHLTPGKTVEKELAHLLRTT
jgi:glucose-1-phosphatase